MLNDGGLRPTHPDKVMYSVTSCWLRVFSLVSLLLYCCCLSISRDVKGSEPPAGWTMPQIIAWLRFVIREQNVSVSRGHRHIWGGLYTVFLANPTCSPAAALPADSHRGEGGWVRHWHRGWCDTTCNLRNCQWYDFGLNKKQRQANEPLT